MPWLADTGTQTPQVWRTRNAVARVRVARRAPFVACPACPPVDAATNQRRVGRAVACELAANVVRHAARRTLRAPACRVALRTQWIPHARMVSQTVRRDALDARARGVVACHALGLPVGAARPVDAPTPVGRGIARPVSQVACVAGQYVCIVARRAVAERRAPRAVWNACGGSRDHRCCQDHAPHGAPGMPTVRRGIACTRTFRLPWTH